MMKQITISILAIIISITTFSFNTTNEAVDLNWKLEKGDTLSYKTIMNEIGESTFQMSFGSFFNDVDSVIDYDFMDEIRNVVKNTNFTTQLTNSTHFDDVLNIEIQATPINKIKNSNDEEMNTFMTYIQEGVKLRGSIHKTGELHSFWVKNQQKNLLSLLFELPNYSVKKGDTWTLDNVNFIGNDQNFVCTEAERRNNVVLSKIKQTENDIVAVIEYDIYEYVSGEFNIPNFVNTEDSNPKTIMEFAYKGQAEFSVKQGKWITYGGIMSFESTGFFNSKQRQKFALIED